MSRRLPYRSYCVCSHLAVVNCGRQYFSYSKGLIGFVCVIEQCIEIQLAVVPDYTIEIESEGRQDRLGNGLDLLLNVMFPIDWVLHVVYWLGPGRGDEVAH